MRSRREPLEYITLGAIHSFIRTEYCGEKHHLFRKCQDAVLATHYKKEMKTHQNKINRRGKEKASSAIEESRQQLRNNIMKFRTGVLKRFRFKNLFVKPSPLPCLSWASSDDVWIKMLNKELKYVHDKGFIQQHPALQPKMRSILLDWLMEVSEVYTLHRETFYLAQDIFDRFMLTQKDIGKDQLQLIGITSLFIASKIEEIYPPKLQEFAYVTDGACNEEEILAKELVMLKALKWELCPETVISWLKLYSQVDSLKDDANFLIPQFSQETYIQITQLLDLCIMDINSLDYQYGVLAAAAFCHFTSFETVHKVSGLTWDSISSCVRWMNPFARAVREWPKPQLKDFKKVVTEGRHNIQTHVDYLAMLSEAHDRQQDSLDRMSPLAVAGILTPPKSTEKPANA
ncbi:hypothetical protein QQF64_010428 [Cirrhinus molitorella]|uniref:Cyclin E2 n=1 Tax=Cirrhinus molitorella TaxID=172907 RepID=A0ABR3M3Z9_9TELE